MKYKVNDYELEAETRVELLEKIIEKEGIKISEFKDEGKFVVLSQRDNRWNNKRIGKSNITIGNYGRWLTCV